MPTVMIASKPRPTTTVVDMLLVCTARVRKAAPSRNESTTIAVGTRRVNPCDDFMNAAPTLKANEPPRIVSIGTAAQHSVQYPRPGSSTNLPGSSALEPPSWSNGEGGCDVRLQDAPNRRLIAIPLVCGIVKPKTSVETPVSCNFKKIAESAPHWPREADLRWPIWQALLKSACRFRLVSCPGALTVRKSFG